MFVWTGKFPVNGFAVIQALERRPLKTDPVVCLKALMMLLKLLQDGSPSVLEEVYALPSVVARIPAHTDALGLPGGGVT